MQTTNGISTVTPERVMMLTTGHWATQLLAAAADHRFFTLIDQGQDTAEAIALAADTDPRGTRMVLDSLAALGLLTKQNGTYGLTPDAAAFLVEGRPGTLAHTVSVLTRLTQDEWTHLSEALKTGRQPTAMMEMDYANEFFPKLIRGIMPLSLGAAMATAEHLGVGRTMRGTRALDVGAGNAVWSIPIAQRDDSSTITALDLPGVLPHTKAIVEEFGVGARYRYEPGNLLTADFGQDQYDIAILGNICHGLTPEQNRELFVRLHRALVPGGTLVVGDMLPNEERTGPPFPVMFAVNMFVVGGADTYTWSEYRDWLLGAGFSDPRTYETHRMHSPVMLATR